MNNLEDNYFQVMKNKFIQEGYFNNGAIRPKNVKEREIIRSLIEKNLVVRRKCILESYELTEEVRINLINDYKLYKVWGDNYKIFKVIN